VYHLPYVSPCPRGEHTARPSRARACTLTHISVCTYVSQYVRFACGSPLGKILLGGGDGLVSTSFPNSNAKRAKSNHRALGAQIKTDSNAKRAKSHHASKGLFVIRSSKKQWCHSYTDVTVIKDDMSYREDCFHLPHTKCIILSDLEVFEVIDVGKSGLIIGVAEECCETMVI
jgi:hypothetical protein